MGQEALGGRGEDVAAMGFEDAYRALEEAVTALERGELSLDASMELYERGVALAERCGALLTGAELRVRRLDGEGNDAGPLEV